MVDVKVRIKEGCRGGREQFTWNSIKQQDFKDRESYLGQSMKVGQMGKFGKYYRHDWYATSRDTTTSISDERESVQAYEEELMQEALGMKPKKLLLAKQQMSEEELKAFLKSKKGEDTGREAMGPQKHIRTNEFGEQVAHSNEDFFAEAVRDKGSLKGLGFASHRDAKLEKIKAATMGVEGQLKGSSKNENLKSEMKLEYVKSEVKTELKTEPGKEGGAQGSSPSKRQREEVKEEDVDEPPTKRRAEADPGLDKKDKKSGQERKEVEEG